MLKSATFKYEGGSHTERCRGRIIWYCAGLESQFPSGYPGSNPGRGDTK